MAQSLLDRDQQEEPSESTGPTEATGEELATRLFSLVMFGVCAIILFMAVMANY